MALSILSLCFVFSGIFIKSKSITLAFLIAGICILIVSTILYYVVIFLKRKAVHFYSRELTFNNLYAENLLNNKIVSNKIEHIQLNKREQWDYISRSLSYKYQHIGFLNANQSYLLTNKKQNTELSIFNIYFGSNPESIKYKQTNKTVLLFNYQTKHNGSFLITPKSQGSNVNEIDFKKKLNEKKLDLYLSSKYPTMNDYIDLSNKLINLDIEFSIMLKNNRCSIMLLLPYSKLKLNPSIINDIDFDIKKIITNYDDDFKNLVFIIKSIQSLNRK
ncbi:MAG: hypothetical protein ACRC4M_00890 [Mycoplasma sp.]